MRDVAALAGVSVGTVSNVVNRPDTVKPATLKRVKSAINDLGYVPNGAARQLRAGQSKSVALVVLDAANPFFADVARGAERRATDEGLTVFLANSDESVEREERHLDAFESQRVFGLLISPVGDDTLRLERLRARGIPVVLVDRGTAGSPFPFVSVDDVAGGALAARHLVDGGWRRIAFVGGPMRIRQVADRHEGARGEVDSTPGAALEVFETRALTLGEGMRVGEEIRARVQRGEVDAVFAANDLLAIGVEQALLGGKEPVHIPGDVALVGYDDIAFAAAAVVPITSVRQPRELIGATAIDLLLGHAESAPESSRRHVIFQPELVVRASSTHA